MPHLHLDFHKRLMWHMLKIHICFLTECYSFFFFVFFLMDVNVQASILMLLGDQLRFDLKKISMFSCG